jgi:hypothetical protein
MPTNQAVRLAESDVPYIITFMENIRKTVDFMDLDDAAKRQYIDARTVFQAEEATRQAASNVRGGMYWRNTRGTDYLIRTSTSNSQKSLGARTAATEAIYNGFVERKAGVEARLSSLRLALSRNQKLNRVLHVGRVPVIVVDILNRLEIAGLAGHFTVVGTHALYAFETAAGVRIAESSAMETRDIDLLWDTRKRLQFVTRMPDHGSMVKLLQKVDPTFAVRQDQRYTATNSDGFEVDILRREATESDPHPCRFSDDEDDFWVVQARNAGFLLNAAKFSSMIVGTSGHMARMNTISPVAFAQFKRWLAIQPDRDPLKRSRDLRQAEIVEALVAEYLPQI